MDRRGTFQQPLPLAPSDGKYSADHINKIVRALNSLATVLTTPGDEPVASLIFFNPALSGYGLRPYQCWIDVTTGIVHVALPSDAWAPSGYMRLSPGKCTVTIS